MIMSIKEFIGFVKNHQKEKLSQNEIKAKISIFESDVKMVQKECISFKCFYLYLMSEHSKIVDDAYFSHPHNLDKPLSCYYINSSHNTYLTGFQIYSNSSVEIYRQCLLRGCRCVEIDCWDGPNSEPMVTHGYAMCTNVDFKDVIVAIKESAFVNSDLPVIISIENHCGSKNQAKMAYYFKEIFGNLLLAEAIPNQPIKEGAEFPSPNTLKMKIILKGKISEFGDKEIDINELDSDDKIIEIVDAIENVLLIQFR
ncbi:hypothetical protein MXB_2997 [Myxobolus squamalis]|nr:hypothetical protein MXB_2997 [Myxobolus squamalis]